MLLRDQMPSGMLGTPQLPTGTGLLNADPLAEYRALLAASKAAQNPQQAWGSPVRAPMFPNQLPPALQNPPSIESQFFMQPHDWGTPAGDWVLQQTGSPLAATAAYMLADPLNAIPGGKAAALPIGIGKIKGVKRIQPMYHGTRDEKSVPGILSEGFTSGESAELKIPGTSLSRDPTVSLRPEFAAGKTENLLRVTPDIDPSDVRNLSFFEYKSGQTGADPVYNKPNAVQYQEAETFLRRTKEQPSSFYLNNMRHKISDLEKKAEEVHNEYKSLKARRLVAKPGDEREFFTNQAINRREELKKLDAERERLQKKLEKEKYGREVPPAAKIRKLTPKEQERALQEYEKAKIALFKANNLSVSEILEKDQGEVFGFISQIVKDTRGNRGAFDKVMWKIAERLRTASMHHAGKFLEDGPNGDVLKLGVRAANKFNLAKNLGYTAQNYGSFIKKQTDFVETPESLNYMASNAAESTDLKRKVFEDLGWIKRREDALDQYDWTKKELETVTNRAHREWVKTRNHLADMIEKKYPQGDVLRKRQNIARERKGLLDMPPPGNPDPAFLEAVKALEKALVGDPAP